MNEKIRFFVVAVVTIAKMNVNCNRAFRILIKLDSSMFCFRSVSSKQKKKKVENNDCNKMP